MENSDESAEKPEEIPGKPLTEGVEIHEIDPAGQIGSDEIPIDPGETLESGIPSLEALTQQIAIAHAADLAREGQYSQAEAILDAIQGEETPAILDLRARIYAQQGRMAESQALWERALAQDPGNPEFLKGLEYVQNAQKPIRSKRIFSTGFWLGLIVILGLILGAIWLNHWNRTLKNTINEVNLTARTLFAEREIGEQTSLPPNTAESAELSEVNQTAVPVIAASEEDLEKLRQELIGALSNNNSTLAEKISLLQDGQTEILAGLQPTAPVEETIQFDLPGIQLTPGTDETQIRFTDGLFAYGWTLKPSARQLLLALGEKFAPYGEKLQIRLIGFQTDEEADRFVDLGLLRAVVVYDYLVKNTQLPAEVFAIYPQGSLKPPFPGDNTANRSRNMTVEMYVSEGNR